MNTQVNYILANQILGKVLIADDKNCKKELSPSALGLEKSIPDFPVHSQSKGSNETPRLMDLSATLALMHGNDNYGANREKNGKIIYEANRNRSLNNKNGSILQRNVMRKNKKVVLQKTKAAKKKKRKIKY